MPLGLTVFSEYLTGISVSYVVLRGWVGCMFGYGP
jgi:hypothetical protein